MNRYFDNLPLIGKRIPGKIVLSFLLLLLSVVMLIVFRTADRAFCLLAMAFSFLGDVVLNYKDNPIKRPVKEFVIGGICFCLSHLLYFATYYHLIREKEYTYLNFGVLVAITIVMAVTLLMISVSKHSTKKLIIGLFYLWVSGVN